MEKIALIVDSDIKLNKLISKFDKVCQRRTFKIWREEYSNEVQHISIVRMNGENSEEMKKSKSGNQSITAKVGRQRAWQHQKCIAVEIGMPKDYSESECHGQDWEFKYNKDMETFKNE